MATSGYSGTPLEKKLGLKDNFKMLLFNEPKHYQSLFNCWPDCSIQRKGIPESINFIHAFFTQKNEFERESLILKGFLIRDGSLWISWPKGSSKIATDLNRDYIRNYLIAHGLVDVKVCAVDEDWSGLKFVYRLKDRK